MSDELFGLTLTALSAIIGFIIGYLHGLILICMNFDFHWDKALKIFGRKK